MARILVTGLPGTGKSSTLAELARRGYRVVDTDDPGWHEYHAYAEPRDELHRGEYHWVHDKMTALLDSDSDRALIVAGIARNQSEFYDRFDAIVLLRAPVKVMLGRVLDRTVNDYGKTELDRAEIIADVAEIEPLLRQTCTDELDTDRPLDQVVADLIAIARRQKLGTVSSRARTQGGSTMSLVRVHNFSISLDGYGAGEPQSLDTPMGHAGDRLHDWMIATPWFAQMQGQPGGVGGVDDALVRLADPEIGAEIMGARKFGYPGWHEDPDWKGWWGDNPPFHTPVFVLTHHVREPLEMEGGTTFYFLDATPAQALQQAREAAANKDIRLGGGAKTLREFIAAGLVDHMHIAVVPIVLGRGTRLWDGLEALENDYRIESSSSPSGVTHLIFTRTTPQA